MRQVWSLIIVLVSILSVKRSEDTNSLELDEYTNDEEDPYISEIRSMCEIGSTIDCFKLSTIKLLESGLFARKFMYLSSHLKVKPMDEEHVERILKEPYRFVEEPRAGLPEPTAFWEYLTRRSELFLKTRGLEVELTDNLTEGGIYEPRFIDEIYNEMDQHLDRHHQDKKKLKNLKKLFIPLLVILKVFKLKLLFLLPLILGVASLKKFLGFLMIFIPALAGIIKLCRHQEGSYGHSSHYPKPSHHYHHHYHDDDHSYRRMDSNQGAYFKQIAESSL